MIQTSGQFKNKIVLDQKSKAIFFMGIFYLHLKNIKLFKFRDFFTFSRKTLIVSRFLVYFYIKNLFFIFHSSLNKPIINRLFTLCNYFLEQRKLAIIWRRFFFLIFRTLMI